MIKSIFFWCAATCLAIIPCLCIDIAQHVVDWKTEVREEIITVVQNVYSFNRQEKAAILDKVFERNRALTFLIYSKVILCITLPVLGFYLLRKYRRHFAPGFLKPAFTILALMIVFVLIKVFAVNAISTNLRIGFLKFDPRTPDLESLYRHNFNGKVLYIDFWGTTCGPCLQEFRNFTAALKDKYRQRNDIAWLYVAQGDQYLWREQVKKYNVEGTHVFTSEEQYEKLYRHTTKDSTGTILMPRYVIIDKSGNVVETNAKQPSDKQFLYAQLDKYLDKK